MKETHGMDVFEKSCIGIMCEIDRKRKETLDETFNKTNQSRLFLEKSHSMSYKLSFNVYMAT